MLCQNTHSRAKHNRAIDSFEVAGQLWLLVLHSMLCTHRATGDTNRKSNENKLDFLYPILLFGVGGIFISAFGILNKVQSSEWSKRNMISPNGWIYWNAIELSPLLPRSFHRSPISLVIHCWRDETIFPIFLVVILSSFFCLVGALSLFLLVFFSLFNSNNLDISVVVSLLSDFSLSEIINSHESVWSPFCMIYRIFMRLYHEWARELLLCCRRTALAIVLNCLIDFLVRLRHIPLEWVEVSAILVFYTTVPPNRGNLLFFCCAISS